MRNFRFSNLHDEDDPVVGSSGHLRRFTIPNWPSGDKLSLEALTDTLGGGYFFLPGMKALEFVARHHSSQGSRPLRPLVIITDLRWCPARSPIK
jgi:putative iron-dependent peroxidase